MNLPVHVMQFVDFQRLGYVATVDAAGHPGLSPKGSLRCLDDNTLVFADIASPGTIANLRLRPHATVNVVDPFERMGYRFRCVAEIIESGEFFDSLLDAIVRESVLDAPRRVRAFVVLHVASWCAMHSPAYAAGFNGPALRRIFREHYLAMRETVVTGMH